MRKKPINRQDNVFVPLDERDVKHATEVLEKPKLTLEQIETIEPMPGKRKNPTKKTKSSASKTIKKEYFSKSPVGQGYTLIITEKPAAAQKIAYALSSSARKLAEQGVPYYELTRDNKKIVVACAVGHLFTLTQKEKRGTNPVFDIEWKPNYLVKKNDFTKKYYSLLGSLVKGANDYVLAMDYDVEGEVIGWNVIRFIAKQTDAKRMKFSTLTTQELQEAYENLEPTINWGQAIAGESRHFLDWMYGINLSRSLMSAIKTTGTFRIMSIGRVQGPALHLVVEKELEIQKFKSTPYWEVFLTISPPKTIVKYNKEITNKAELEKFKGLNGKYAEARTEKSEQRVSPLFPFDLTTLQTEAYKFLGLTPAKTLQVAQKLYLAGLISYPRTSSQQIPDSIAPKKILEKLSQNFSELTKHVSRTKPVEGKKSDPAHPSIYPTGEYNELDGDDAKLYNLILTRFIACFCSDAIIDNKTIIVEINNLKFTARGIKIREKGWMNVYKSIPKETHLEDVNGKVKIDDVKIEEKMTQPPRRYSPASIVSELEKRNLGTKCLTGDTKIMFDGEDTQVEELFNKAKPHLKENNSEIRKIAGKTISLNNKNEVVVTNPKLISRRKLKEGEKIIKIKTDLSEIKLTENHIVYISRNNKIETAEAKDLKINDKIIAIPKEYKEGNVIIDKSFFNERYKIENGEIVHKFSAKTIKGIKLSHLPIRWTKSLAWVLGYFYGDGSYNDKKYNGSYQVFFTTTENKALNLLKKNIKDIFGNEPYCYDLGGKYKVNCNSAMAYALTKTFPNLDGKKPFNMPKEFIGDFLRGFFDADGNVHLRPLGKTIIMGKICNSFGTPRIKMTLGNRELIEWVSSLLKELGIENHINQTYAKCKDKKFDCWTIRISGKEKVEKFAYEIGFDSYKEDILYKGLKCNSLKYKIIITSALIACLLHKSSLYLKDIIEKTNERKYNITMALRRLYNLGIISKKRDGRGINQKWSYSFNNKKINYLLHSIKLIYSKIKDNLYEAPIKELSIENYNGYVYDISVEKEAPNFITEGNLLVHNSTRANIIETLYSRGYIKDTSIQATHLGIQLIETLEKYSPIIIDEKLTRKFEQEADSILESKPNANLFEKEQKIINEAKIVIKEIYKEMKEKEKEIGGELLAANNNMWESQKKDNELIECPVCKTGKLSIMYSKKTRRYFIACNAYPNCKTTFSLPPNSLIKKADKICDKCQFPKLLAIRKAKRPWEFCFNPECESNKAWQEKRQQYKEDKEAESSEETEE